jgi:hypothetical protein
MARSHDCTIIWILSHRLAGVTKGSRGTHRFTRSPKLPIRPCLLPEDSVGCTRHFKEPVRPIMYAFSTVVLIPICLHQGSASQLFA